MWSLAVGWFEAFMASWNREDKVYKNSIIITNNTQNNDKQAIDALARRPVRHPYFLTFASIKLIRN